MSWIDIKKTSDGYWLMMMDHMRTQQLRDNIRRMDDAVERLSARRERLDLLMSEFDIRRYGVTTA